MNTAFQNLRKATRDRPKEKIIVLHGYIRKQKDQTFNVVSICLQKEGPRAKQTQRQLHEESENLKI